MEITDSLAKFTVNTIGDSTKETYMGTFKVKCLLTPVDHISSDRLYRELLGNNPILASEKAQNLAFALSQLKFRVVEYPPFWTDPESPNLPGGHIVDQNVIVEVLNQAIDAEDKYLEKNNERLKEMQDRIAKAMKSKAIEKEPENPEEQEEDLEIDLEE
jgi:uncharacterized coiled-coil protein SlyX